MSTVDHNLQQHTKAAVDQKKITIPEIDRALHNLFSVRMRLGLFNGDPTGQQFGNIGPDQVCSQENQMLALDAARDGIVLLKNSAGLLPLSKSKTMSLAVIGPNADSVQTLLGNYAVPANLSLHCELCRATLNTPFHTQVVIQFNAPQLQLMEQ